MDFLPLAIWAVGMGFVSAYEDRTLYSNGWSKEEIKKKGRDFFAFWLLGCAIFFLLGVLS